MGETELVVDGGDEPCSMSETSRHAMAGAQHHARTAGGLKVEGHALLRAATHGTNKKLATYLSSTHLLACR